jgi:hypothetical protein
VVEHRAQRVDVRARVHALDLAARLLGRHVGRRADDAALDGAELVLLALPALEAGDAGRARVDADVLGVGLADEPRQAPVHHEDLAEAPDHHVARLQVAVDHALRVGVAHRLRELEQHRRDARRAPAVLAAPREVEDLREGAAAHSFIVK